MDLHSDHLTTNQKNHHLPMHDFCIHQPVMYQDATSKKWYPAKIVNQCEEPRSYIITTEDGVQYRKTQKHLKPYQPRPQMAVSPST